LFEALETVKRPAVGARRQVDVLLIDEELVLLIIEGKVKSKVDRGMGGTLRAMPGSFLKIIG